MRLLLAVLLALGAPVSAHASNPKSFVHLTTRGWFTLDPAAAFTSR
ncbi:MAG: hypothetical protein FD126_3644 [Elusimicrobia bacterium]|nr:MAG: hypothetical protein FD126_3644 [Elusimicrobiota bacterium]